ncbi:MAG: hypothetical protein AVDCRST_MAG66-3267, partial [uncultured Pseudonocardia sp.]
GDRTEHAQGPRHRRADPRRGVRPLRPPGRPGHHARRRRDAVAHRPRAALPLLRQPFRTGDGRRPPAGRARAGRPAAPPGLDRHGRRRAGVVRRGSERLRRRRPAALPHRVAGARADRGRPRRPRGARGGVPALADRPGRRAAAGAARRRARPGRRPRRRGLRDAGGLPG